jgi:hypothetical protein
MGEFNFSNKSFDLSTVHGKWVFEGSSPPCATLAKDNFIQSTDPSANISALPGYMPFDCEMKNSRKPSRNWEGCKLGLSDMVACVQRQAN